jgi:hypothetical protein
LASTPVNISALDDIDGKNLNVTLRIFTCKVINIGASKIRKYMNLSFMAHQSSVEGHHKDKKRMEVGFFSFRSESRCSEIPGKKSIHRVGGEINKEKIKTQTHLGNQRRFGLDTVNYTGITSSFDVTTVIKPRIGPAGRPGTRSTSRLDRSGFVKRPAGATTQQNPVDLMGRPMTRTNLDETLFF